jgi:CBS domain-containing protein
MDVMQPQERGTLARDLEKTSPTGSFYRVNSFLPDEQALVTIQPDSTVADAIRLMQENEFSQLPVVEGHQVLGVFSYRSFSARMLEIKQPVGMPIGDLPVDEFIENLEFVHISDDPASAFDLLDRDDAVLVGQPGRLQGILTAIDVLRRLYSIASPFVLLAEIELTLRSLIAICVDQDELEECVRNSLEGYYQGDQMPLELQEMTFNDYVQIVGDGRNWSRFERVFGPGEWKRKATRTKLTEVRDVRNDAFHFKRDLTNEDLKTLVTHRDWLFRTARRVEARRKVGENDGKH